MSEPMFPLLRRRRRNGHRVEKAIVGVTEGTKAAYMAFEYVSKQKIAN